MSKKLVIKINNLGAIDEDALARKHEVEQLLWGRIVGAIAAGVVLLLLAVWFVFSKSASQTVVSPDVTAVDATPTAMTTAEAEQSTQSVSSGAVADQPKPVIVDKPPAAAQTAQPPVVAEAALPAKTALADAPDAGVSTSFVEQKAAEEQNLSQSGVTPKLSDKSGDEVVTIQSIASQPMPSAGDSAAINSADNEVKIKLLSDGIVHAQLAHALDNEKKPVDTLTKSLRMNAEGLLRVYLYTEIRGLSGTTLYHTWYLNGDRMARVRIPVVRDDYRASSSKFIDTMMLGTWQVTITDDSGKPYADVSFVVTN
jgi:hypothetical protein